MRIGSKTYEAVKCLSILRFACGTAKADWKGLILIPCCALKVELIFHHCPFIYHAKVNVVLMEETGLILFWFLALIRTVKIRSVLNSEISTQRIGLLLILLLGS